MTPEQLFAWANAFARGNEKASKGTVYPTVRLAAKHFRTTQQAVLDACEDYHGDGYMKPATGFQTGSGIGTFERPGDYLVEAYK
jgi:hypothetical protein